MTPSQSLGSLAAARSQSTRHSRWQIGVPGWSQYHVIAVTTCDCCDQSQQSHDRCTPWMAFIHSHSLFSIVISVIGNSEPMVQTGPITAHCTMCSLWPITAIPIVHNGYEWMPFIKGFLITVIITVISINSIKKNTDHFPRFLIFFTYCHQSVSLITATSGVWWHCTDEKICGFFLDRLSFLVSLSVFCDGCLRSNDSVIV